jgi:hypothetical protein
MGLTRAGAMRLLGVTPSSTPEEIRAAYRTRAFECHPDRNPTNPDAAAEFDEVNAAFRLLSNEPARPVVLPRVQNTQPRRSQRAAFDPNSPQYARMKKIASILLGTEKVTKVENAISDGQRIANASISSAFDLLGIPDEELNERTKKKP